MSKNVSKNVSKTSKNYVGMLNAYNNILAVFYCLMCICEMLESIFVVLKLIDVINWKWMYVLTPLWVSMVIAIIFIIVRFVIKYLLKRRKNE